MSSTRKTRRNANQKSARIKAWKLKEQGWFKDGSLCLPWCQPFLRLLSGVCSRCRMLLLIYFAAPCICLPLFALFFSWSPLFGLPCLDVFCCPLFEQLLERPCPIKFFDAQGTIDWGHGKVAAPVQPSWLNNCPMLHVKKMMFQHVSSIGFVLLHRRCCTDRIVFHHFWTDPGPCSYPRPNPREIHVV